MKSNVLIALSAFITLTGFVKEVGAVTLSCDYVGKSCENNGGLIDGTAGDHIALYGETSMRCSARGKVDGEKMETNAAITITGVGPGLRFDKINALKIVCPNISLEDITTNGLLELYGGEVAASAVVGSRLGFFKGESGKYCFIAGASLGAGASLTGGALQIWGPGSQHQISLPRKCYR